MPSAASIIVANSVPTNKTYVPVNVSGYKAVHQDITTAATPIGRSGLELVLRPATSNTAQKVDMKFSLPVELVAADGSISVKDVFRFNGSWLIPPNATLLQRADFEALVRNLVSSAVVKGYVKDGDPEF